jgi:hypothetical protein
MKNIDLGSTERYAIFSRLARRRLPNPAIPLSRTPNMENHASLRGLSKFIHLIRQISGWAEGGKRRVYAFSSRLIRTTKNVLCVAADMK